MTCVCALDIAPLNQAGGQASVQAASLLCVQCTESWYDKSLSLPEHLSYYNRPTVRIRLVAFTLQASKQASTQLSNLQKKIKNIIPP